MDKEIIDERILKAFTEMAEAVAHLTPIETLGMLEVIKYSLLKAAHKKEETEKQW